MSEYLKKINAMSNMNIIFLEKGKDLLKDYNLDFFNLIFTKNGVYKYLKNEFITLMTKIDEIKYTNIRLKEIEERGTVFDFNLKRIPEEVLVEILDIFKYVVDKTEDEFMCVVYYDKRNDKYIIDMLEQEVSSASVNFTYSDYEKDNNYFKVLEIHSHNTMSAFFSGVDDRDEKGKPLVFFGVIGKINNKTNIYNMDYSFRISDGEKFYKVNISDIFDINIKERVEIKPEYKKRIDKMLRKSKRHYFSFGRYNSNFDRNYYEQNKNIVDDKDFIDYEELDDAL